MGATLSAAILENQVKALVGKSAELFAKGMYNSSDPTLAGIQLPNRTARRRGVLVSATANEMVIMISIAAAGSGNVAVTGVVNTIIIRNIIQAQMDEGAKARADGDPATYTVTEGTEPESVTVTSDVLVEADDDSTIINLAGSLAASGSVGVGATIVALIFDKTVSATVGANAEIHARGSVAVTANSNDSLWLLAVAFAGSGSVGLAGGANALVFMNHVTAMLGGTATAGGAIDVTAHAKSLLVNIAAAAGFAGTVGGTGVAVITYFYNETIAYVLKNARLTATKDVCINASSEEFVTADAAGMSGSGTVSFGGTLDVIVTKVVTKAYTQDGVQISGKDISVLASDKYELLAIVATVAVSGVVGVGVSALAAVFFNTIAANIGKNNTITASGNVKVSASSNRTANAFVFTAGGGQVGVAGTVAVVVAGGKLTQDAHDGIYASNDDTNQSAMDPQAQTDNVFTKCHSGASADKPDDNLNSLLAGDGQNANDLGVNGNEYGQDKTGGTQNNMNDELYDNTAGNSLNKSTGPVINGYALEDATSAIVGSGSVVTANGGNIDVLSSDSVNANLITGTLAVGLYAGVGVGISVMVLFSNVQAVVESGATLSASGIINVKASAGSPVADIPVMEKGDEQSTADIDDKLSDSSISNSATSTIRLISVTGGGGIAGVSVAVAALVVFTEAHAILAGDVTRASSINVLGHTDFGEVLAVTLGVSGGFAAVSGSVSGVYYDGTVESCISGTAHISGVSGGINVQSTGTTNAIAAAGAFAGGVVAVNAGVAVAINRTRIDTYIGRGVTINAPSSTITVSTDFTAQARAIIVSVALGGVAVGVTVALAINRPVALTYIGITPYGTTPLTGSTGTNGLVRANAVQVTNDIDGDTYVYGLGVAAGTVAVNGAVALGFNRVTGYAAINKANVQANTIDVQALMDGDTNVIVASLVGGYVAVGAIVALAQIKSDNRAIIDVTGASVSGTTVRVKAGTETTPYDSQALVSAITGSVGVYAVVLNFAIAINSAGNRAMVLGDKLGGIGSLNATNLSIYANGNTRAYAIIAGASIGGFTGNVSVSTALLTSYQEASLAGTSAYTLGSLSVVSDQNKNFSAYGLFDLIFDEGEGHTSALNKVITFTAMAQAYIFSAAAGLGSATASAATARANASGYAIVSASDLTVTGALTVHSNGRSVANAKVDNLSVGLITVGVMVGYSYAQGTFVARLQSNGGIQAQSISVLTDYDANSTVDLTPALGGVDLALVNVEGNTGYAEINTTASASIEGTGTVSADTWINVITTGDVSADCKVHGVTVSASYYSIVINLATAVLNAHKAHISAARPCNRAAMQPCALCTTLPRIMSRSTRVKAQLQR